jgi:hypothetical protein
MSALAGLQVCEARPLLWDEALGEEITEGRGKTIRRSLRLGIVLLIILLLIGVVWVVPVASQSARAPAEIAASFVAIQSIV